MGANRPKQYLELAGVPVLVRSVATFAKHDAVEPVQPVCPPGDEALVDQMMKAAGLATLPAVAGGSTRQESVRLGLQALARLPSPPDCVLVHDAARPLVSRALIERVIAALDEHEAVLPAIAVTDSLKRIASNSIVQAGVARDGLMRAQTPQGFNRATLTRLHEAMAGENLGDDTALFEAAGLDIALVEGDEMNIKITHAHDIEHAHRLGGFGALWPRIGSGFDVHGFAGTGDHVTLCGVQIAHSRGLSGHSDADVGLHALSDAIFGAIGAGDIGQHFPPSDPQWKGADSTVFLAHAASLVRKAGGHIGNLDITLICEAPKIGPHREAMQARIAEILGLSAGQVSVKATTTEKLGFTGRGEGIAAQATALVMMPPAYHAGETNAA